MTTVTATSSETTENHIALLQCNNKLSIRSLAPHTRLQRNFVDDVILRVVTADGSFNNARRPVLAYSLSEVNIFEEDAGLRAHLHQSASSANDHGITALTGRAGHLPNLWYAYFETLEEDCLSEITSHWQFESGALWLQLWSSLDKSYREVLAESAVAVQDSWCQLNSADEEVAARIDHSFELVGLLADAEVLVWTNPLPTLLYKQQSEQNLNQTATALNFAQGSSRLVEQLSALAEENDLVMVNTQLTGE